MSDTSNKHRRALRAIRRAIATAAYHAGRGDSAYPSDDHRRGAIEGLELARRIVRVHIEAHGIGDVPEEEVAP